MGPQTVSTGRQIIGVAAFLWACFVIVVITMILTGKYDPIQVDGITPGQMPFLWAWYVIQIVSCLAVAAWSYRLLPNQR